MGKGMFCGFKILGKKGIFDFDGGWGCLSSPSGARVRFVFLKF
jgi:hypothetical protein